jgi:phosphoribosyl 1,2-cyclic phosphodiesterase/DNA-binding NarL/FixJ family response regulator
MKSRKKRILIADESKEIIKSILAHGASKNFHFESALSGTDCLQKISEFHPDLIILDLMLPEIHGIEILKVIKSHPRTRKIGVIISSAQAMIQNYHAALKTGADYFLEKPFAPELLFTLIKRFFAGKLHPDPFSGKESEAVKKGRLYKPHLHRHNSYIKFWGTRGSNPVAGPEYVRYGGNTSCLEVRHGDDLIIIDAGSGIRPLGETLSFSKAKTIHLFLSHTHWDHITGFPFFNPIYNHHHHVCIWAPIGYEKTVKDLFTDMLAYAYFPVRLDDIEAKLTFKDLLEGETVTIGAISITTHYAFHPGATLCFKIQAGGKTFGYASDNEVLMGYHGDPSAIGKDHKLLENLHSMIKFFKDCDFLIHEAQYTDAEYQKKVGWGHSSVSNASVLVKYCDVKEWILTHHDPTHTDEQLEKKAQLHKDVLQDAHIHCQAQLAHDGLVIPL